MRFLLLSTALGLAACKVDVSAAINTTGGDASSSPPVIDDGPADATAPIATSDASSDAGDGGSCRTIANSFDDPNVAGWSPSVTGTANRVSYASDTKTLRAHTGPNTTATSKPEYPASTRAQLESSKVPAAKKIACKLKVRPSTTAPVSYDVLAVTVRSKDQSVRRYRVGYYQNRLFGEVDAVDEAGTCKQCPIPSKQAIAPNPTPLSTSFQDIELTIDDKGMTASDGRALAIEVEPTPEIDTIQVRIGLANLDIVEQDADFDDLVCQLDC